MVSQAEALGSSSWRREIRVVLYSHDSLGLGHLRRNLLIASAFGRSKTNIETLLVCGSGYANAFQMPSGVDILSLPSLAKVANGRYVPKQLHISPDELTEFRSSMILSALKAFRPNIFVVDKVPRGVRRELDPVLTHLRRHTDTKIVLGLRDILDHAERVRAEWKQEENLEAINEFYDDLWVYGDPTVYDLVSEYGWAEAVGAKTIFTGYLDRVGNSASSSADADELIESLKLVDGFNLVVVGGGADGYTIAENAARADTGGAGTLILTGPFMPHENVVRLKELVSRRKDVSLARFSSEPVALVRRAGRVVSMGGYNTLLELVGLGKKPLVVPRVKPRTEQLIRATRFRQLGLVDVLHPDDLSPDALTNWFSTGEGLKTNCSTALDLDGLSRIVHTVHRFSEGAQEVDHAAA